MNYLPSFSVLLLLAVSDHAGAAVTSAAPSAPPAVNWQTGEGVSLGGVLFPHVHLNSAYGRTNSSLGHELGAGHHDPVEDGWTVQGVELGFSGRWNDHFETYVVWHGFWENEDPNGFGHELEEYFLKLKDLTGGFDIRAGRFLSRFGLHNATHLHGWDWADNFLVNGRFLGDDGQYTEGAEVTWNLPVKWSSAVSMAAGRAKAPEHEEEDEHEEHEEALFEGEGAAFDDMLYTINWTNIWEMNDFHKLRGGLSYAWGDNTWNRMASVFGAHVEYVWQKNGPDPGGNYLRWRTEVMLRDVKAIGEHHEEEEEEEEVITGSFDEVGIYSSVVYGFDISRGTLEAGLRADWVEGVSAAGLPERTRFSPAVSWYLNDTRNAWLRVQYNRDQIQDSGSEDSVWLGAGFNWGGAEVR